MQTASSEVVLQDNVWYEVRAAFTESVWQVCPRKMIEFNLSAGRMKYGDAKVYLPRTELIMKSFHFYKPGTNGHTYKKLPFLEALDAERNFQRIYIGGPK